MYCFILMTSRPTLLRMHWVDIESGSGEVRIILLLKQTISVIKTYCFTYSRNNELVTYRNINCTIKIIFRNSL